MIAHLIGGILMLAKLDIIQNTSWDDHVKIPQVENQALWNQGRQVLHFYRKDKDYRESDQARAFVTEHFQEAKVFDVDAALLKYAVESAQLKGAFLDMGICTGRTLNFIAGLKCDQEVYGFDSFEGLPEDWNRSDIHIPKGTFASKNNWIPTVLLNVSLVKGHFADTLPLFKQEILKDQPIAFMHIDCELYCSTNDIFQALGDHIVPGTVILFDELYNYSNASEHEFKAFQEFLARKGLKARWIGFNQYHEQAAAQIIE